MQYIISSSNTLHAWICFTDTAVWQRCSETSLKCVKFMMSLQFGSFYLTRQYHGKKSAWGMHKHWATLILLEYGLAETGILMVVTKTWVSMPPRRRLSTLDHKLALWWLREGISRWEVSGQLEVSDSVTARLQEHFQATRSVEKWPVRTLENYHESWALSFGD